MSEPRDNTLRALIVCGLWLQVGFIGATTLAVGMRHMFNGGPDRVSTTLVVCGAALAAGGWRRGRIVLKRGATSSSIAAFPSEARS